MAKLYVPQRNDFSTMPPGSRHDFDRDLDYLLALTRQHAIQRAIHQIGGNNDAHTVKLCRLELKAWQDFRRKWRRESP